MRVRNAMAMVTMMTMAAVAVGCGSSGGGATGTGGNTGGSAAVTAKINGVAFSASGILAVGLATAQVAGSVTIQASTGTAPNLTTMALVLSNISGTGTYPLGVSTTNAGGLATLYNGATLWTTPLSGVAGTVTITTLTATRIAGTFSFQADTGLGSTTAGGVLVTDGAFDVPLNRALAAVPDNYGDKVAATLGTRAWNAAFIGTTLNGSGLSITTFTTEYYVTITLTSVSAPGTYALSLSSPSRFINVTSTIKDADHCCWGLNIADTGTITVTSVTATRVKGTFSATLTNQTGQPATGPLAIAGGTFDVGLR